MSDVVTNTDDKDAIEKRFGAVCEPSKLSTEPQKANPTETLVQRSVRFERSHSSWLSEQNQRFETQGLWCDDIRVW
jgi:hypothetical protein